MKSRCARLGYSAFLFLIMVCGIASGQNENLPPLKDFFRECRDALAKFDEAIEEGEESTYELTLLAEAEALSGDETGGIKLASAIQSSLWRPVAVSLCLSIQAKRGKYQGKIPDGIDETDRALVLIAIAEAYAEAGDFAKASATADQIIRSRGDVFIFSRFYQRLAQAQIDRKAPEADIKVTFERAVTVFKESPH